MIGNRKFPRLRFMASAGEPLNPEAVLRGQVVFDMPFHDNWRQTETGGIMIANYAAMDVRPGSMGKPLPGIAAGIVEVDGDGYYWFVARGDDVIKSAGHLIGPFEVESALIEHDAVA